MPGYGDRFYEVWEDLPTDDQEQVLYTKSREEADKVMGLSEKRFILVFSQYSDVSDEAAHLLGIIKHSGETILAPHADRKGLG